MEATCELSVEEEDVIRELACAEWKTRKRGRMRFNKAKLNEIAEKLVDLGLLFRGTWECPEKRVYGLSGEGRGLGRELFVPMRDVWDCIPYKLN